MREETWAGPFGAPSGKGNTDALEIAADVREGPEIDMGGAVLRLGLAGCTSPEEQRAEDQSRCSGYGFQPGSESFAHCMMSADMRRDAKEQADKDRVIYSQGLSRSRNGNTNYPVCSAISPNGHLDVSTGKWAGPDCRQE